MLDAFIFFFILRWFDSAVEAIRHPEGNQISNVLMILNSLFFCYKWSIKPMLRMLYRSALSLGLLWVPKHLL